MGITPISLRAKNENEIVKARMRIVSNYYTEDASTAIASDLQQTRELRTDDFKSVWRLHIED